MLKQNIQIKTYFVNRKYGRKSEENGLGRVFFYEFSCVFFRKVSKISFANDYVITSNKILISSLYQFEPFIYIYLLQCVFVLLSIIDPLRGKISVAKAWSCN